MRRTIKFNGKEIALKGIPIELNEIVPDFRAIDSKLDEVTLSDFKGKIKLFTTFPSLDTPVCDKQINEFNGRAQQLSENVCVIGLSMDLPFAINRFCEKNNIRKVKLLSDHRYTSFGLNYGLLIKDLHLLARSVLIVDENDVLRYYEIVEELDKSPDYDRCLAELENIINQARPLTPEQIASREYISCCEGASPLTPPEINEYLSQLTGWELVDHKKIVKDYHRQNYQESKDLLDDISVIADEQGHHPTTVLGYDHLKVILTTHSVGELTENDFVMAGLIDDLAET
ncbi:MAG: thiol peroxidase [Candidatus Omnitrophota bacterium]